jgi:hypothetical protein
MGISRIDQPEKYNHGYYVRVRRNGKTEAKFFADKGHGGKRAALRAAKEYETELISRAESKIKKKEAKSERNTSGKVGVSRTESGSRGYMYSYWQAAWVGPDGKRKSVKFSINKYGEEKAKRMALKARREALQTK